MCHQTRAARRGGRLVAPRSGSVGGMGRSGDMNEPPVKMWRVRQGAAVGFNLTFHVLARAVIRRPSRA